MNKLVVVFSASILTLAGCGPMSNSDLLEEASWSAALSEGDGEELDEAGLNQDDVGAASENVDGHLDGEADLEAGCSLEGIKQRIRTRYDQNGNGRLERAELRQLADDLGPSARLRHRWMRHYRLQRLKWVYDEDEDGRLSRRDRQQLREDLEARCQNRKAVMLENFDHDGDGSLDDDEWSAARAMLRARIQARLQESLALHDANQNGVLDESERQAMVAHFQQLMAQKREQVRQQYDMDGDGMLNQAERNSLRQELHSRIRGEQFSTDSL